MTVLKDNVAVSENGFVFNPETGESFSINPAGQILLTMMKEERSYQEIKENIMSRYYVDDATFEKDFQDFINMLKQYQLAEDDGEET